MELTDKTPWPEIAGFADQIIEKRTVVKTSQRGAATVIETRFIRMTEVAEEIGAPYNVVYNGIKKGCTPADAKHRTKIRNWIKKHFHILG